MAVLIIPVGKTRIFSRLEYHTLRKPKTTPITSNTIKWVGMPRYCAKNQSKMGLITAAIGFYDLHIKKTFVHHFKNLLYFCIKYLHYLIVIPINLGTERIFQNCKSGGPQFFYKMDNMFL